MGTLYQCMYDYLVIIYNIIICCVVKIVFQMSIRGIVNISISEHTAELVWEL